MNVTAVSFKPKMAWNQPTMDIYQKIERSIARLQSKCNDTMPDLASSTRSNSQDFLLDELEKMLQNVSTIHIDIKRLQILKAWLCIENTTIIGNLLTNNTYLNYSEQQLEKIIRVIS